MFSVDKVEISVKNGVVIMGTVPTDFVIVKLATEVKIAVNKVLIVVAVEILT